MHDAFMHHTMHVLDAPGVDMATSVGMAACHSRCMRVFDCSSYRNISDSGV